MFLYIGDASLVCVSCVLVLSGVFAAFKMTSFLFFLRVEHDWVFNLSR